MIKSGLDEITGIGPKTKELLLKEFASVERIKNLSHDDLKSLVGDSKSRILLEYFRKNG
jgi:excinuclease ABC subunit C